MTDEIETAVDDFLDDADDALEQYDRGYADADATLRLLRARIDELREAAEE